MKAEGGGGPGLWVSRTFWSTYRNPPPVEKALIAALQGLGPGQRGLNVGAGLRPVHPALVGIDLVRTAAVDCVADARRLPFQSRAFALVLSQETLEHVADPFLAMREIGRVLEARGRLVVQTPFVLGYHPDPEDYWRFTAAGVRGLFAQAGLRCEEVRVAFGAGTGLHRIVVEFGAGVVGRIIPAGYRLAKGAFAILFFPLKWLDGWLAGGGPAERIAGGYVAVGSKPG